MSPNEHVPSMVQAGGYFPEARGFVDGEWYYEENVRAVRLGLRLQKKLHQEKSPFQTLAVYDTTFFGKVLTLDDAVMLTERDEFVYHEMLTHLPLCSMADPKSVLIIGGGDCGCLREILKHESVTRVVQVDIDERVTRVCEQFFPWTRQAASDPRAELLFDDGIHYIDKSESEFDLIIVDSTDPKGPGVVLFLADFYQKVARALKPGGVMVAQTETPHWQAVMMGAIYQEMRQAFPLVSSYLGWIPTYPSGCWSWAYASASRQHGDYLDEPRAKKLESTCLYYNRDVHRGAFAQPNFVKKILAGENPFRALDESHRRFLLSEGALS